MGKLEDKRKLKNYVLHKIMQNKGILFGAISDTVTKSLRKSKWKEIAAYAQSLGVIHSNRDACYLRDVWWPNVRKSSLIKIDSAHQIASAGGTGEILTEVDNSVLSIIGKNSSVIEDISIPDSMEHLIPCALGGTTTLFVEPKVEKTPYSASETCGIIAADAEIPSRNTSLSTRQSKNTSLQRHGTQSSTSSKELAKEKHEWEIKLMKIKYYKAQLDCRQLELTLGIPVSEFTRDLPDGHHNNRDSSEMDNSEDSDNPINENIVGF